MTDHDHKRRIYHSFAKYGNCMVCGQHDDLRMGACFGCSDRVVGELVADGKGHRMWDIDNPENTWYVGNA